jgi:hypothetical protein
MRLTTDQDLVDARVKKLAAWYSSRLVQDKRTNGREFYKFEGQGDADQKKAEEERCRALSLAGHNDGDMLPDDWRYDFVREALGAIEDASDFDDIEVEADIYNSELTDWLGSHGHRPGYCDEAVEEGLVSEDASMIDRIQMGQYMEKREVLAAVLLHLREEAEEQVEAEEEAREEAEASAENAEQE